MDHSNGELDLGRGEQWQKRRQEGRVTTQVTDKDG
jgi:hypothetical protein